jgi:WhiB family transcriptional regulator, redox-sensing transcriptional regulator
MNRIRLPRVAHRRPFAERNHIMADTSRLPGPQAELWDWQFQGSCRATGSERFFHPEGERGTSRDSRDAAAKAICRRCPVAEQCRSHALKAHEPYGVWGGMTEGERADYYARERSPARRAKRPAGRGSPANGITLAIGD